MNNEKNSRFAAPQLQFAAGNHCILRCTGFQPNSASDMRSSFARPVSGWLRDGGCKLQGSEVATKAYCNFNKSMQPVWRKTAFMWIFSAQTDKCDFKTFISAAFHGRSKRSACVPATRPSLDLLKIRTAFWERLYWHGYCKAIGVLEAKPRFQSKWNQLKSDAFHHL